MAGGDNGRTRKFGSCFCFLFTALGFYLIISYVILATARSPKLSLLALQLPVNNASTLSFKLRVYNPNLNLLIQFSNLNTLFHFPANQSSTIANFVIPAYYQSGRRTYVKGGNGITTSNVNLKEGGGEHLLRVNVIGKVRYESWLMRSRWRALSVGGVARLNTQGYYATENGERLIKSGATVSLPHMSWYLVLLLVVQAWY